MHVPTIIFVLLQYFLTNSAIFYCMSMHLHSVHSTKSRTCFVTIVLVSQNVQIVLLVL